MFAVIREGDLLVHHPYESFENSVEAFIEQAARDPIGARDQADALPHARRPRVGILKALIRAAAEGKQVVCIVELKARFDEEANIAWAQELEDAGVHVAYGVVGLKTHAKLCLAVRNENAWDPPLRAHRHRQLQPGDRPRPTRISGSSRPTPR